MGWIARWCLICMALLVLPGQAQAGMHGADCPGHAAPALMAPATAGPDGTDARPADAEPHRGVCRACSACCSVSAPAPQACLPAAEPSPLPGPQELDAPAPPLRASRLERPPRDHGTR